MDSSKPPVLIFPGIHVELDVKDFAPVEESVSVPTPVTMATSAPLTAADLELMEMDASMHQSHVTMVMLALQTLAILPLDVFTLPSPAMTTPFAP